MINVEYNKFKKLTKYFLEIVIVVILSFLLYFIDFPPARIQASLFIFSLLMFLGSRKIHSENIGNFFERLGFISIVFALVILPLIFGGFLDENSIYRY